MYPVFGSIIGNAHTAHTINAHSPLIGVDDMLACMAAARTLAYNNPVVEYDDTGYVFVTGEARDMCNDAYTRITLAPAVWSVNYAPIGAALCVN